jgi:hypothetical protein
MSLSWKFGLPLFFLIIMLITTPYFGTVETRQFSAYAACRKVALARKGYAVWKPKQTTPKAFRSEIIFSDGYSNLDCHAWGIGPFWIVRAALLQWSVCNKDLGNGNKIECTEDYFGVIP